MSTTQDETLVSERARAGGETDERFVYFFGEGHAEGHGNMKDVLGGKGALFTSYTDNVTSIKTPDAHTVIVNTKRPDARIVGGLFIYILPKHIWGKVPVKQLTGSYQPDIPMVGSGPYVVTDFQPNRFLKMDRNPYWRGPKPPGPRKDWAIHRAARPGAAR